MNWDEFESTFTDWDSANPLTWDLSCLDKYELIAKTDNSSVQLPPDIQENLRLLCTELAKNVPEKKTLLFALNLKTIGDAVRIGSDLSKIIQTASDYRLWEKLIDIYEKIISLLR